MPGDRPIGIDARAAAEVPAGRGRYVRELLKGLERIPQAAGERFVLYARQPWGDLDPARFTWSLSPLPDPLWHLETARRANRETRAFLSTNSYLTAWFTRVPTAVAVMDLVAFVDGAQSQARAGRIERATIRPALHRAQALLCISEATRDDLQRLFPHTRGRTRVTPLAADPSFSEPVEAPGHPALPGPYVLAVGTLEPRKNLERLLDAWLALDSQLRAAYRLALVGPRGWDDEAIVAKASHARAQLLGRVSDDELRALYAGAAAFAYPSLYEGFGLPPLEAMTAGAPVLTSAVSSLPEVVGDAALTVDPHDVGAITAGLRALLTDRALADRLRSAGRERARLFDWDRTAIATLDALRSMTRSRRG
ncbi:glycosyltransferase family 1 protein [Microbacterium sp. 18062]|uniref:glycosyltransferase family 4 protein n=1 Tax=Microbacterium sp. 18062 TaxID=2681410 RepID=UPI0013588B9B|nr:glycosyltransferase family 1 protein [Microbacterium sp. 18062]